jgi:hypothetical protein
MKPTPNHLTPSELAARLGGISLNTLKSWRHLGTGPHFIAISRKVLLYPVAAVEAWEAARTKTHSLS